MLKSKYGNAIVETFKADGRVTKTKKLKMRIAFGENPPTFCMMLRDKEGKKCKELSFKVSTVMYLLEEQGYI